jgi:chaperonin GroES
MADLTSKRVLPTKILLLPPKEEEKKTQAGIIIPETAGKVTSLGTVVITGEGTDLIKMSISIGQKVMYSPHAGIRVRYEDEDYVLLNLSDVLLYW